MRATVLYYSHTGRTAAYAREIAMYLWSKSLDVSLSSISDFDRHRLLNSDIVLSGCWTCGWFVIGQHPHRKWVDFSKSVADFMDERKIMFFTTYKIRTGSMHRKMQKTISITGKRKTGFLKSKTARLTDEDKTKLDTFIQSNILTK